MIERFEPKMPQSAQQLHGGSVRQAEGPPSPAVDAASPGRDRQQGHKPGLVVALVAVGALVVLGVIGAMKFVSDPVGVEAKHLSVLQASVAPKPSAAPTSLLSGLNFEFNYPGLFDQVSQTKSDPQVIEQYRVTAKKNYHRTIAVDVRPLVLGGLADDGSYKIRHLSMNAKYSETNTKVNGEAVVLMTRADNQEKTIFWPHQAKLLTISVTSDDPHDDVPAMTSVIEASVRWRQ